jgi:rhodanese-related sulfurtransferase
MRDDGERRAVRAERRRGALRVLGGAAFVLAVAAAFVGSPTPGGGGGARVDVAALARQIDREEDHVTALELAQWIRDRKPGLRVLDVRSDSEYAAYHVPSAVRLPLSSIDTLRPRARETLVLYSEGGAHAAQAWVLLRAAGFDHVYFLRGGLLDWVDDVMNPVVGADTSRAGRAADERTAALSRYFGGVPRTAAPGSVVPMPSAPLAPRATTDAIARTKRRGC